MKTNDLIGAVLTLALSGTAAMGIDTTGSCAAIGGTVIVCDDWDDYSEGTVSAVTGGAWQADGCNEWQVSSGNPFAGTNSLKQNKIDPYPGFGGRRNKQSLIPRIQELNAAMGSANGTDTSPLELYFQAFFATSAQLYYTSNVFVELNDGVDAAPTVTEPGGTCGLPHVPKTDGLLHQALAFGALAAADTNPCPQPENGDLAIYNGEAWLTAEATNLNDQLITLNTTTGLGTLVGTVTGYPTINAMAFDPATGKLYATVKDNMGQLITIDTSTAAVISAVNITGTPDVDHSQFFKGLAFNPNTGKLFAANDADNYLYEIDPATGVATRVGVAFNNSDAGISSVQGLAYDSANNRLYGVMMITSPDQVLYIKLPPDPNAGEAHPLGEGHLRIYRYDCRAVPMADSDSECIGCCGPCAPANQLAVSNASFENPVLPNDGDFDGGPVPSWTESPGNSTIGVLNLAPNGENGAYNDGGLEAADGVNVAYLGTDATAGSLEQTLGNTVVAGTPYTLSVAVSRRNGLDPKPYTIELLAGGTVIASISRDGSNLASPVGWTTETLRHVARTTDPHVGATIGVRISVGSGGTQTLFDNVRLLEATQWCKEVADESFNNVRGLEFDANTGTLYATDGTANALITISTDPANRSLGGPSRATRVTPKGQQIGFESVEGLGFDPNTNTLYGANQHVNPPEQIKLSSGWNHFTVKIKTDMIDIHLENGAIGAPFDLTVPRAYLGSFAELAIGDAMCLGSKYAAYADQVFLRDGVLTAPIDPTGACCLPGQTVCAELTAEDCSTAHGKFNGIGSKCATFEASCEPIPFADANRDGDVDQQDFAAFQRCFSGTYTFTDPACAVYDRDVNGAGDGDVDEDDFAAFEKCATGPGIAFNFDSPPAGCVP